LFHIILFYVLLLHSIFHFYFTFFYFAHLDGILLLTLSRAYPKAARAPPEARPACAPWQAAISPYFVYLHHILLVL
jgi:hypothetical protein